MPSRAETRQTYSSVPQSAVESAASLRAPMRGEVMPIAVTTASVTFNVPEGWKNRHVNVYAESADIFIQVSTGLDASVDETARAGAVVANGRTSLTAAANGCWRLVKGQWIALKFESDCLTFALKGDGSAGVLRAHVAET